MEDLYRELEEFVQEQQGSAQIPNEEHPVVLRGGGEEGLTIVLGLYAPAFAGGYVWLGVDDGYMGLRMSNPQEWVERNCSGLVYVCHHVDDEGVCNIIMRVEDAAIKPVWLYPYMISGDGGGEFQVFVNVISGASDADDAGRPVCRNLFFEDFCNK